MNENEPHLSKASDWLSDLRKPETEESAQASAILEKYFNNAGLKFIRSGETKTWSGLGWDLYVNLHELLGDEKHTEMLRSMLVVECIPVVSRLAGKAPALMMMKSGSPKFANSSRVGRISIVCMKSAW